MPTKVRRPDPAHTPPSPVAGGMLSCFVRPDDARAPLAFLHGWPHVIIAFTEVFYAFGYLYSLELHWWGFAIHLLLATIIQSCDGLISNSFGRNIEVLRANGFQDGTTVAIMAFNLVSSQILYGSHVCVNMHAVSS